MVWVLSTEDSNRDNGTRLLALWDTNVGNTQSPCRVYLNIYIEDWDFCRSSNFDWTIYCSVLAVFALKIAHNLMIFCLFFQVIFYIFLMKMYYCVCTRNTYKDCGNVLECVNLQQNVTQRQVMRLFAVKLMLSYEQKCKVRSKFLKNWSMLKNKLWYKFYEFINSN